MSGQDEIKFVEVESHSFEVEFSSWGIKRTPVITVIKWLQDRLQEVPEAFRPTAHLRIYKWDDDEDARLHVIHHRPENDEERRVRQARDRSYKRESEERERRQYLDLKAKYEGKK